MRIIIPILLLTLNFHTAIACSCAPEVFSVKEIIQTNIVFKGKVIRQKIGNLKIIYTFRIEQMIKGNYSNKTIDISTSIFSSACGVTLKKGREIYLFAYRNSRNKYSTSSCHRTSYTDEVSEKFHQIINDFQNANSKKFWLDIEGDTVAFGKVRNRLPVGYWKFFINKKLSEDGSFKNGLKAGVWNYYSRKKDSSDQSQSPSATRENMIDPNCREVNYVKDFDHDN